MTKNKTPERATRAEIEALHALARARGVQMGDGDLTIAQVATLAGRDDITVRRAIWAGTIEAIETVRGYQISIDSAARYAIRREGQHGA